MNVKKFIVNFFCEVWCQVCEVFGLDVVIFFNCNIFDGVEILVMVNEDMIILVVLIGVCDFNVCLQVVLLQQQFGVLNVQQVKCLVLLLLLLVQQLFCVVCFEYVLLLDQLVYGCVFVCLVEVVLVSDVCVWCSCCVEQVVGGCLVLVQQVQELGEYDQCLCLVLLEFDGKDYDEIFLEVMSEICFMCGVLEIQLVEIFWGGM